MSKAIGALKQSPSQSSSLQQLDLLRTLVCALQARCLSELMQTVNTAKMSRVLSIMLHSLDEPLMVSRDVRAADRKARRILNNAPTLNSASIWPQSLKSVP